MFDSWDNLKYWETCITEAQTSVDYDNCRLTLYNNTGVYPKLGQGKLTSRQFWSVILTPIAEIFFWLAVLFIGWILYKTGQIVLPLEETIREVKERKRKR
jgi:hypothetical protein